MAGEQIVTLVELIPANGHVIEFTDVSPAQAALYAEALETDLRNAKEDAGVRCEIERIRTNPAAQELGTVIAVILSTQATIAIAKGIAKWLSRNDLATI